MATAKTAPIAEVMHLTGDRLRLRIQELKTDAAFRDLLSAYLKALQGIKSVHVLFTLTPLPHGWFAVGRRSRATVGSTLP